MGSVVVLQGLRPPLAPRFEQEELAKRLYRRESLAGDEIDWGHSKCVLPTPLHTLATVWEAQAHFVWLLGEAAQHSGFPLGPMQSAPRLGSSCL